MVLLLCGNTRQKGDRRRTVQKAVDWLIAHAGDTRVRVVLAALARAELSSGVAVDDSWRGFVDAAAEGEMLRQMLGIAPG